MEPRYTKNFADTDEVVELEVLRSEIVDVAGITVSRDVMQPGWRWSRDNKPIVGTELCMLRHVGVVLRGTMGIELADGIRFECRPLDVVDIPPDHDGWVVGDEPLETIAWSGVRGWLDPLESLKERLLTTMVFTDIVDSTGTAHRMGDRAWGDLVGLHESRVRDVLGRFRGHEVKMTGDGVLAIFDSAARAVRAARALIDVGSDLGIAIRASVHTGEVEVAEADLRGVAVHEAARILDLAGAGDLLVSATTAALADAAGVVLEDAGEHELRGLDGPRRIYRVP